MILLRNFGPLIQRRGLSLFHLALPDIELMKSFLSWSNFLLIFMLPLNLVLSACDILLVSVVIFDSFLPSFVVESNDQARARGTVTFTANS